MIINLETSLSLENILDDMWVTLAQVIVPTIGFQPDSLSTKFIVFNRVSNNRVSKVCFQGPKWLSVDRGKYLLFEYFSLFEKTKNYKKVKMGIFLRRSGTIPFVEINIQFTEWADLMRHARWWSLNNRATRCEILTLPT